MDRDVTLQISKTANMIRRRMSKSSVLNGLTYAQTRVLYFILKSPESVFQKDIEAAYMLRPSTATALLQSLEQADLIERKASEDDGRKKRILLTEEALSLKEDIEWNMGLMEECMTKGISREDLDIFFRVTDRMIRNLQNANTRR